MAKHISKDSIPSLMEHTLYELEQLRSSKQSIHGELNIFRSKHIRISGPNVNLVAKAAIKNINSMSSQAVSALRNATNQKTTALRDCRNFQLSNSITRQARKPDRLKTVQIGQFSILIEGSLTGLLFIADGAFGIVSGMASGLAIASINIAAGFTTGFFPARYIGYRQNAPAPKPQDRKIRLAALLGLGVSFMALSALHFGAARVRVTGEHQGIFNFETVGLFETFNDYYTLALIALGAIGAIISIFHGRHGICDPIIDYTEISHDAENRINKRAYKINDNALDAVDQVFEEACDSIEEECEDLKQNIENARENYLALNDRINAHNNEIDNVKNDLKTRQHEDLKNREFMAQKKLKVTKIDFVAFDALSMPEIPPSDMEDILAQKNRADPAKLIASLQLAHDRAASAIHEAYTAFQANAPQFNLDD